MKVVKVVAISGLSAMVATLSTLLIGFLLLQHEASKWERSGQGAAK